MLSSCNPRRSWFNSSQQKFCSTFLPRSRDEGQSHATTKLSTQRCLTPHSYPLWAVWRSKSTAKRRSGKTPLQNTTEHLCKCYNCVDPPERRDSIFLNSTPNNIEDTHASSLSGRPRGFWRESLVEAGFQLVAARIVTIVCHSTSGRVGESSDGRVES